MSPVQPSVTPLPTAPPPPKDPKAATYEVDPKATYAGAEGDKK